MIRIGIIGLGGMGRVHFEAYQKIEGAKVVGVCDADPRRVAGDLSGATLNLAEGGLQRLPECITGTTDFRELIARDDIDVIDVCTATPTHVEIATAALKAGRHVVCEKPLGRSPAEVRPLVELAGRSEKFFMPAMCIRFWPAYAWLKRAAIEGRFGQIRSAVFRRRASIPGGWFRDGNLSGGGILDLHVHDVDFVYHLLGRPAKVFARGYNGPSGAIDHIVANYIYNDLAAPAVVIAEGAWTMGDGFGFDMSYTVTFDRATVDFDFMRKPPLRLIENGRSTPIDVGDEFGYVVELRYFIDCIRRRERPTVVTADDALNVLHVVEAEKQSVAAQNLCDV